MNEGVPPRKLIAFLREKKSLVPIVCVLIIGVVLMLFGGSDRAIAVSSSLDGSDGFNETELEARIKQLCERVDGVSDAAVMVCLESEVKNGSNSGTHAVKGIAIVCVGGDDPVVQLKLSRLLSSLFDIGADRIGIIGAGM